jgi:hypothetical protein
VRSQVRARLSRLRLRGAGGAQPPAGKTDAELSFWRERAAAEGALVNDHYERVYLDQFRIDRAFFAGKRVLDIGCGPRSSLEWLTGTSLRVGLDPLAVDYRELGTGRHAMRYVAAGAE